MLQSMQFATSLHLTLSLVLCALVAPPPLCVPASCGSTYSNVILGLVVVLLLAAVVSYKTKKEALASHRGKAC